MSGDAVAGMADCLVLTLFMMNYLALMQLKHREHHISNSFSKEVEDQRSNFLNQVEQMFLNEPGTLNFTNMMQTIIKETQKISKYSKENVALATISQIQKCKKKA